MGCLILNETKHAQAHAHAHARSHAHTHALTHARAHTIYACAFLLKERVFLMLEWRRVSPEGIRVVSSTENILASVPPAAVTRLSFLSPALLPLLIHTESAPVSSAFGWSNVCRCPVRSSEGDVLQPCNDTFRFVWRGRIALMAAPYMPQDQTLLCRIYYYGNSRDLEWFLNASIVIRCIYIPKRFQMSYSVTQHQWVRVPWTLTAITYNND